MTKEQIAKQIKEIKIETGNTTKTTTQSNYFLFQKLNNGHIKLGFFEGEMWYMNVQKDIYTFNKETKITTDPVILNSPHPIDFEDEMPYIKRTSVNGEGKTIDNCFKSMEDEPDAPDNTERCYECISIKCIWSKSKEARKIRLSK